MHPVQLPTLLLGVGATGGAMKRRAVDAMVQEDERCEDLDFLGPDLDDRVDASLDRLLAAGQNDQLAREPRLDLIAFAALEEGPRDGLVRLCDWLGQRLSTRYATLFPQGRAPEQRTAGLHLILSAPPLSEGDAARRCVERLRLLERWAAARPYAGLLSRVWIVSRHTTAGILTQEDVERTCALFTTALVSSGVRLEDAIRERMEHHRLGPGLFGFVAVASLDIPDKVLRIYAERRAAFEALSVLVERVERPAKEAMEGLSSLAGGRGHESWLAELQDGQAAQRLKAVVLNLGAGDSTLPSAISVTPADDGAQIRARYPILFQPLPTAMGGREATRSQLVDAQRGLDIAESLALERFTQPLRRILDDTLSHEDGLRTMPEVLAGLRSLHRALEEAQTEDALEAPPPPSTGGDPTLAMLEETVEALPSPGSLWQGAAVFGLGVATVVRSLVVALMLPSAPVPGAGGKPLPQIQLGSPGSGMATPPVSGATVLPQTGWEALWPWLIALAAGIAAALIARYVVGLRQAKAIEARLEARREALSDLKLAGGMGPLGHELQLALHLRRRRSRRSARLAVKDALERLELSSRRLREEKERCRQALLSLGIEPDRAQGLGDIAALLGPEGRLHGALVPPAVLGQWVQRCRLERDPEAWTLRFLREVWPPGRTLLDDCLCGDGEALAQACHAQVGPLREESIFEFDEASKPAGEVARGFVARITYALGPACVPLSAHGDAIPALRGGEVLLVAPRVGKDALDAALSSGSAAVTLRTCWTHQTHARLLFIQTWEGYHVEDIARGAGAPLAEEARER